MPSLLTLSDVMGTGHHAAVVAGGPAPARAYIDGRIEPGKVLDRSVGLDGVPDGYRAMAERESSKVMVRP